MSSSQLVLEVFNAPEHALHFKQEWCVVLLAGGELPARIPNGSVVDVSIDLKQDCSKTSRIDFISDSGVGGQSGLQAGRVRHA